MSNRAAYGGQAVIEGVMIRGKSRVATACRLKDGTVTVRREAADTLAGRHPIWRLAFLRGTPALIDSLRLGYRTLMWSADLAMEGEEDQPKPTPLQLILTFAGAMAIGIGIFVLIPTWLTHWLSATLFPGVKLASHAGATLWEQLTPTREALVPNTIEGLVRVVFLVLYILAIGTGKEIRRVFAYHGAEHKVVNAWEATGELTLETARGFSRIHPRCGTSFLFLTFVVGILIHALIGWPEHHGIRMLSRLILLPFVAGTAYELIRLAGRFRESNLLKVLVWPGMLLQRLTTAEPTDDQIEVALTAMRNVLEEEGELPADDSGAAPLTSVIVV